MQSSITEAPLTADDLAALSRNRDFIRKIFFLFFPLSVVGVFVFTLVYAVSGMVWVFGFLGLMGLGVYLYSENRFKKDIRSGTKRVLKGPVEMTMTWPGNTVEFTIDYAGKILETRVRGMNHKHWREPFVLSQDTTDEFFYWLSIQGKSVKVERAVFLDFYQGELACIETTLPGTLIRYRKISDKG